MLSGDTGRRRHHQSFQRRSIRTLQDRRSDDANGWSMPRHRVYRPHQESSGRCRICRCSCRLGFLGRCIRQPTAGIPGQLAQNPAYCIGSGSFQRLYRQVLLYSGCTGKRRGSSCILARLLSRQGPSSDKTEQTERTARLDKRGSRPFYIDHRCRQASTESRNRGRNFLEIPCIRPKEYLIMACRSAYRSRPAHINRIFPAIVRQQTSQSR